MGGLLEFHPLVIFILQHRQTGQMVQMEYQQAGQGMTFKYAQQYTNRIA